MVITLQALAEEHIPTILEACADWSELAQYGPPYWRPRSSAELRRKIADTAGPQPATAYSFVLADSDGRLVGEASIHAIDWRSRVAQVGICIWRPSDRGQGYGAAGSRAVIDWAVGHLGLHRLEAWIVEGNAPLHLLAAQIARCASSPPSTVCLYDRSQPQREARKPDQRQQPTENSNEGMGSREQGAAGRRRPSTPPRSSPHAPMMRASTSMSTYWPPTR